jgi:lysophospholipase L1-like esterase
MEKPSNKKHIKFPLLLFLFNILIFFLVLLTFEMVLRVMKIGYGNIALVSDPLLHHVHPKNYTFLSYSSTGEYGNFLVHYDNEGLICNPSYEARKVVKNPAIRIAFMGDSYTEARQVEYKKSAVGILEESVSDNAVVKNYGVTSYCPILYYLQWKYLVSKFKPTHVFLMLSPNDIDDDYNLSNRAVYSPENELVAVPGLGNKWWVELGRRSYVVRFFNKFYKIAKSYVIALQQKKLTSWGMGGKNRQDIPELSSNLVLKLEKAVLQSGGKFILMVAPSKSGLQVEPHKPHYVDLEFSEKWKIWSKNHGIAFIDLSEAFHRAYQRWGKKLFFDRDVHFTPEGHKVVAETIAQAYPELFNMSLVSEKPTN